MIKKIFTENTMFTMILIVFIASIAIRQANHKDNIDISNKLISALKKSQAVKEDINEQYKLVVQRYETIIFMLKNK